MPRKRRPSKSKQPPYYRQRFLCSAGEWRFCRKLEEAVGDRFVVMMQVSVAALIRVPPEEWKRWGGPVAPMRFDFVLVERGSSFAAAAVELDDKTHRLPERIERDRFLEDACERAGVPLIRFKIARRYDVKKIHKTVTTAVAKGHRRSNARLDQPDANSTPANLSRTSTRTRSITDDQSS